MSREHGYLKSKKEDVEFLRQEGDNGKSSLYNALARHHIYQVLVAKYWQTCDDCTREVPKLHKLVHQLNSFDATSDGIVEKLDHAINEKERIQSFIRPGQTDVVCCLVTAKCETLAASIALTAGSPMSSVAEKCGHHHVNHCSV